MAEHIERPMNGEIVSIEMENGERRTGKILECDEDRAVIQVFEGTEGLSVDNTKVKFSGDVMKLGVAKAMLGRVLNGQGKVIDGGSEIVPETYLNVEGSSISPVKRIYPKEMIQTGISAIDVMASIARGQKIPLFSGSGLPHNEIAAQICRQAKLVSGKNENFAIVFAGLGLTHDAARFFQENFTQSGAIQRTVLFLNTSNSPTVERITTPRLALTAAEYLAYVHNYHVLVILTDMNNYCDALRQISIQKQELPGRKSYPGYLYTDLASLYERAGRVESYNWFLGIKENGKYKEIGQINCVNNKIEGLEYTTYTDIEKLVKEGKATLVDTQTQQFDKEQIPKEEEKYDQVKSLEEHPENHDYVLYKRLNEKCGSITQIDILTLQNDDITGVCADLTGYIVEGQIFVSRALQSKNLYPCIDPLPSLSRLMKSAIGEGMTRDDHADVSNQLYYCYAYGQEVQSIKQIVGEESISAEDKKYLTFLEHFENEFLKQGENDERSIDESLDLAWKLLKIFDREQLTRISTKILDKYYDRK